MTTARSSDIPDADRWERLGPGWDGYPELNMRMVRHDFDLGSLAAMTNSFRIAPDEWTVQFRVEPWTPYNLTPTPRASRPVTLGKCHGLAQIAPLARRMMAEWRTGLAEYEAAPGRVGIGKTWADASGVRPLEEQERLTPG